MPAPVWFVQFFKALGFTLHAVPMNLWYAGLLVALCAARCAATRTAGISPAGCLRQMPVIVAVGVNLGIVPLLFVQLAYYSVFYPATILMAWFWLAIIVLLIPAYYGVYAYAWGLGEGEREGGEGREDGHSCLSEWGQTFLSAQIRRHCPLASRRRLVRGRVLCGHRVPLRQRHEPDGARRAMAGTMAGHSTAGAALGTALNTGDPTLWPRWLLMFGLALGTTAAWVVFDAEWFAGKTVDEAYRRWAWGFARWLSTASVLWFAAAGTWYVFGTGRTNCGPRCFPGCDSLDPCDRRGGACPGCC